MYGPLYDIARISRMTSRHNCRTCFFQCGLLLLALMLRLPELTAAEIFKWTDERGRIHYGDRPQGQQAIQVDVANDPASDNSLEQRVSNQQRLLEVMEEERQQQKQTEADEKKSVEKRQANCKAARNTLEAMQNSRYLFEKTGDPYNPDILTAAETKEALAMAASDVKVWCEKIPKP